MISRCVAVLVLGSLGVATAVLGGCDRSYVYQPTVATTSAIAGRTASYYAVPPEAPRGSVQLATFGFAKLRAEGATNAPEVRAIHMRMVVANNSPVTWTLDTREQLLSLPGGGASVPAYAIADAGEGPLVVVPPSGKRTIDLFYPLPASMDDAEELPAFDTVWKVQTDTRAVADRTPFERLEVVPYHAVDDYYYWGGGSYYDPYYPRGAFVGVRAAPGYYGHHTVVINPGHGGYGHGHGH